MKLILEEMAANPTDAYFGLISTRHCESKWVREAAEGSKRVLAAMIERLRTDGESEGQPLSMARAALGSREALVRRELLAGRAEDLPRLLPDFVYSASVGFLGQEEALEMARRARELLRGSA